MAVSLRHKEIEELILHLKNDKLGKVAASVRENGVVRTITSKKNFHHFQYHSIQLAVTDVESWQIFNFLYMIRKY
jgi:hypothetical protein